MLEEVGLEAVEPWKGLKQHWHAGLLFQQDILHTAEWNGGRWKVLEYPNRDN